MTLASGANVSLSYVEETTRGETPISPSMKPLRLISRPINKTKTALVSQERRADRQIASVRHGFNSVDANFGFELSLGSFDDVMEAALSGTWASSPTDSAATLQAEATGNYLIRPSGSFIADGFYVGAVVNIAGFATSANNGRTVVTGVEALQLKVAKTLTDEAANAGATVTALGQTLKVGATLRTFTIERRFTDIGQYQVFRGVAVNNFSVNIQPDQIIGGNLEWIGMSGGDFSNISIGVPSAASSNEPLVSFQADLYLEGERQAVVTGLNFQLANGRTTQPVVGSVFSPDVFEGTCQVTGQFTAFFEDPLLYNYFNDETEATLTMVLNDMNGTDFINFCWPRVKVNSGDMDPPQEGPITTNFNFQALVDSISQSTMIVQTYAVA